MDSGVEKFNEANADLKTQKFSAVQKTKARKQKHSSFYSDSTRKYKKNTKRAASKKMFNTN